jgi:hypothetical protein
MLSIFLCLIYRQTNVLHLGIVELWVDSSSGLAGQIPTFVGGLSTLMSFSLSECDLTGTLPSELGNLSAMGKSVSRFVTDFPWCMLIFTCPSSQN